MDEKRLRAGQEQFLEQIREILISKLNYIFSAISDYKAFSSLPHALVLLHELDLSQDGAYESPS